MNQGWGNHGPVADSDISRPVHYTSHPSGIECIQVAENYNFCIGSAIKYLWRHGLKGQPGDDIKDLRKAIWYIEREIANREKLGQ